MQKPLFLIDYENIQPDFKCLKPGTARVTLILGSQQARLAIDIVMLLQVFGSDVGYVLSKSTGKNAADFILSCQLGRVITADPSVKCVIVSADTGFDPLVSHLVEQGFHVARTDSIEKALAAASAFPDTSRHVTTAVEAVEKRLSTLGATKPKLVKSLMAVIDDVVAQKYEGIYTSSALLDQLIARKFVSISGKAVSYPGK